MKTVEARDKPLLQPPTEETTPWREITASQVNRLMDWLPRYRRTEGEGASLRYYACLRRLRLNAPDEPVLSGEKVREKLGWYESEGKWDSYIFEAYDLRILGYDTTAQVRRYQPEVSNYLDSLEDLNPWFFLEYTAKAVQSGFSVRKQKMVLDDPAWVAGIKEDLVGGETSTGIYAKKLSYLKTLGVDVKAETRQKADEMRRHLKEIAGQGDWTLYLPYAVALMELGVLTPNPRHGEAANAAQMPALKRFGGGL